MARDQGELKARVNRHGQVMITNYTGPLLEDWEEKESLDAAVKRLREREASDVREA